MRSSKHPQTTSTLQSETQPKAQEAGSCSPTVDETITTNPV